MRDEDGHVLESMEPSWRFEKAKTILNFEIASI